MTNARPWTVRRMMVLVAWLLPAIAGITWLSRAVGSAREAARAAQCTCHLKCIGLAMLNYESAHGSLPPAYSTDAAGRPLLSWRVLILPYLELQALHSRFRLDEPWDGPNNRLLLDEMPRCYACPTHQPGVGASVPGRFTNYLATAGPGTAFPGAEGAKFADFRDGRDRTLLVVESDQAEVPWTAPIDLDARTGALIHAPDSSTRGPTTPHPSGLYVATAEDRILRLDPEKLRPALEAASTIAGGEAVPLDDLEPAPR